MHNPVHMTNSMIWICWRVMQKDASSSEAYARFGNRREQEGTGSVYTLWEQDASLCITLQRNRFEDRACLFLMTNLFFLASFNILILALRKMT